MIFRHFSLPAICLAALLSATTSCGSKGAGDAAQQPQPETPSEVQEAASPVLTYSGGSAIAPDKTLPTIIDFNATWCGPCQRFAPIFENVARQYAGKAIFLSVDVDLAPAVARQFEVSSIPQLTVLLPDGSVESTIGFMDRGQFVEFISPYLAK